MAASHSSAPADGSVAQPDPARRRNDSSPTGSGGIPTFHGEVVVRRVQIPGEVLVPGRHGELVRRPGRQANHGGLVAPHVHRHHHHRPDDAACHERILYPKGQRRRRPVPGERRGGQGGGHRPQARDRVGRACVRRGDRQRAAERPSPASTARGSTNSSPRPCFGQEL